MHAPEAILDLECLKELESLGAETPGIVLGIFLEDAGENMAALKQAVEQQNLEQITFLAHGLKGSCANIGLRRLSAALLQLEKVAKKDRCKIPETLQSVMEAFEVSVPELKAYLATRNSPENPT